MFIFILQLFGMSQAFGITLSAIVLIISIFHFYWAIGGKFWFANTLPGNKVLNPTKFDAVIVAVGLLAMSAFILIRIGFINFMLPLWMMKSGLWIIAGIFILRAIGDFRYVGFFKSVKHSAFAKADSHYYSPLCLLMGVLGILIEL